MLKRYSRVGRSRPRVLLVVAVVIVVLAGVVVGAMTSTGPFGFLGSGRTAPASAATLPVVELAPVPAVNSYRAQITLRGKATGAKSVTVAGTPVRTGADGQFEITLPRVPSGATVVATNRAGETTTPIAIAVRPPATRAVHVTADAWAYQPMRDDVLTMAREGRINTVQLDIKDEDGVVGYDSQVPLARQSGAAAAIYSAPEALKTLHDMGIRVVGRIVAFRDRTLAEWAWHNGHPDWVVQNPGGAPYSSGYGAIAFTNFASPDIRRYNIDLATEAAQLGFDDIMYDYIRRPDGPLSSMVFPGLTQSPAEAVVGFLHDSRGPVRAAGAFQGAAVFGIAATRPDEIAQDIPRMAGELDYVAPMLYPSHWNAGEYDVADPNAQPYDIIFRALADFHTQVDPTGAVIMPWLQDFTLGFPYGDTEVRAQIRAAAAQHIDSFFLWNPAVSYHEGALDPH